MVLGVLAGFSDRTPYPSGKRSDEKLDSHLYQARREYRRTSETAGKSGKQIERCVIASFQVAESMANFANGSTFC
jgi:hypothetical protein